MKFKVRFYRFYPDLFPQKIYRCIREMSSVILVLAFLSNVVFADEQCSKIEAICNEKVNCQECIRAHHCCLWCYDEKVKGCVAKNSSKHMECDQTWVENNVPTHVQTTKDVAFTDVEDDVNAAVQFRPAEFNIDLRYGEPVNISIQYKPARNFPLDLYYLMDLTLSMEPDLDILKELGSELTTLLTTLTKNYRIAFGSYVDKPEMPFYATDRSNYKNPCNLDNRTCEPGYLFKHKLNFTKNIDRFIHQVNRSRLSANLDDLEGGMDALMQIILCDKKLGWDVSSRKLVLIATGGSMHLAGDGILAGYVKRNNTKCWIDDQGNYSPDGRFDYPSLEEIYHKMISKKTNLILAAKPNIYHYYKEMELLLKETIRVEKLINTSSDVLNVVREGYYNFIKQVNLFINETQISGLQVDFFSDCDADGIWEKGHGCNNAMEGKEMDFKVQFTLNEYQDGTSEVVYIQEKNINEAIKVNLNFVASFCNCSSLPIRNKTCEHGELICGDCVCSDGWVGDDCSEECKNDYTKCRFLADGVLSMTCSGRGDCTCSKCDCYLPQLRGDYCEYECPYNRRTNQICDGHGDCINGTCICDENYSGSTCDCYNSIESCTVPGFTENVCSENGECTCNRCHCKKGYSGQYCEQCDECHGLCSNYEPSVVNYTLGTNSKGENEKIRIEKVDDLPQEERACVYRYDTEDGKKCDIFYKYEIHHNRTVVIRTTDPICNKPLAAGILAGIIVAAFLAAIALIIIVWKGRNWYLDKKEYEQFLLDQDRARHSEHNPIYKNPVTEYRNPIQMQTFHSKNE